MSQHLPVLITAGIATGVLPFLIAALLDYRRKSRLYKQQNFYYLGKPKAPRKKLDHWLVGYIYKRRWTRMRTLLPKLRTAKIFVIPNRKSL